MAAAMPLNESSDEVILTFIDLPPIDTASVPVPIAAAWSVLKAPDDMLCEAAICDTTIVYVPAAAPVPAVAVMPVPLAVAVKLDCSEPLKSGARPICNSDKTAESEPIADS